ncbi:MAG TPA: preprotein translocase subunit SecE [Gammaproteobacteria bacterium]|nr:preprotein translocase subunit SecE [Gammaproteobacteria bacterium]
MKSQAKANVMTIKTGNSEGAFNKIMWLLVTLILAAGIVANYYYSQVAWALRLVAWLVGLPIVTLIALQTKQGKQALEFIKEARVELRKITWPARQETVQTTFIIAAMVVILSIVLWGVDGVLMWLVGWLTGQRG